ncbi:glycosyltransferase [Oceanidesulfovibrio marinus]|uniref:Glycosyltransferase family 4 protein n=1 Tax=Oceanidesulfovibrio marinus TaxID=370038 RepID=A0ABX6NJY3_9BACT|nr:glycosyltransferase family 1 protein [Oceanidesulfovibrio marinus]QJT10526.1 glycosyltransferase family 4 protein [Oceanidesulfovibrio marinus]
MRTFIFLPPLGKQTGGTAQLIQVAAHLDNAGFDVCLVTHGDWSAPALAAAASLDVERTTLDEVVVQREDIWLAPEGWPNAMAPALDCCRVVVWCQNWAYLFSGLPEGVHWKQLPVSFLAVSRPVAWYIDEMVGAHAHMLWPGIDLEIFHPAKSAPAGPPAIAWMPRKNKALAHQIRVAVDSRRSKVAAKPIRWVEIDGLAQWEVAEAMRSCRLFLATGFPEGCALPPLEAMASGLFVVGFAGVGCWDYMRQAWQREGFVVEAPYMADETCGAASGPAKKQQGNGFFVADADVPAAAIALCDALELIESNDPRAGQIVQSGIDTAQDYGREAQARTVKALWRKAEQGELFPGP